MLDRTPPSTLPARQREHDHGPPLRASDSVGDFRRVLRLIRRQRKLIGAVALLCNLFATIAILQLPLIYRAYALILVAPTDGDLLDADAAIAPSQVDSARIDSEVEILRSPVVARAVLERLDRNRDPVFQARSGFGSWLGAAAATDDIETLALERLRKGVTITRKGLTAVIQVAVKSSDPERAAMLANAFAEEHGRQQLAAKIAAIEESRKALDRAAATAAGAFRKAEVELAVFVKASVETIGDNAARERLRHLIGDLDAAARERGRLEDVAARIEMRGTDWQELVVRLDIDPMRRLEAERRAVERLIEADGTTDAVRARLDELGRRFEREYPRAVDELRGRLQAMRDREAEVRAQLVDAFQTSDLSPAVLQRLVALKQAAVSNRELYLRALAASAATSVQREAQLPDSRTLSRAAPPSEPSFPQLPLFFALGGLASVATGVAAAFLRENYLGGLVDVAQAERRLGIPVLAALPKVEGSESRSSFLAGLARRPHSAYAEAIRRARFDLDAMTRGSAGRSGRTILVTSAVEGEGKTVTAVALARAFARSGRKTLLVDCDLRRPALHNAVGVAPRRGLFDYLSSHDRDTQSDMTVPDPATELTLILGSPGRRTAADTLLESGKLEQLLVDARRIFDVIILDSAPALPVTDPRLLVAHADAVLMVVRWGGTAGRKVAAAIADLDRVNPLRAPLIAVLNGADEDGGPAKPKS